MHPCHLIFKIWVFHMILVGKMHFMALPKRNFNSVCKLMLCKFGLN